MIWQIRCVLNLDFFRYGRLCNLKFYKGLLSLFCLAWLIVTPTACANMQGDLFPDSTDLRTQNGANFSGVGDIAPEKALYFADSSVSSLYTETSSFRGVVLYFTMWCSLCNAHADYIVLNLIAANPDIRFILVDYVSGTLAATKSAAIANGYYNSTGVVSDNSGGLSKTFAGTMGTVVVLDSANTVRMNEDFRDGQNLVKILPQL